MIQYTKKSIFNIEADAYINPVNCMGVMGAGLAKQFKQRYPHAFKQYYKACNYDSPNTLDIGKLLFTLDNDKWIIHFPTKYHWGESSKYDHIIKGIDNLVQQLYYYPDIRSLAIPKLGCGLGNLKWNKVQIIFEQNLSDLDLNIIVSL